jgi:error-prone DNA polymerase
MGYIELRAHTGFSFGDGSVTPEALVVRAKHLGYTSLAITDSADLGGIVRFALEAMTSLRSPICRLATTHSEEPCARCERTLRPIIGAELNVFLGPFGRQTPPKTRLTPRVIGPNSLAGTKGKLLTGSGGYPIALLARTGEGYRNLASLITRARVGEWGGWSLEGQASRRGRPVLAWAQIAERSEGLHLLTGPASGPLATLIRQGDGTGAELLLRQLMKVFGDRLAVEVQLHNTGGSESALAGALIDLANRMGVPWVVTNDPRYLDDTGRLVHDMLTAIRHGVDIDTATERGLLHPNGEWRLQAPERMARRWQGREDGLRESERIAEECGFEMEWLRPPLPDYVVPAPHDNDSFLRERTLEGARERWGDVLSDREQGQIDHELALIRKLGFAGFFLVMWDAVHFARTKNILCQGRGSAANSAVAYCLGITAVDPVKHGLLFERFLSETRIDGKTDAPDIDVDIEHDRREEVLDYMYSNYRRSHAAITCTVQTYRAPNAVRDAMRALGYPVPLMTSISKRLQHFEPTAGAERIRETLAAYVGLDIESPRGRALLQGIAGFEGLPRLRSTHVGGFVLSSQPLGDHLPIEQTTMGRTIVQFDKDDLDALGTPKFDFLGLGALSLVRRSFDVIERRTGARPNLYRMPEDDPTTYELIGRGETIGTFQIESRAQIASILHTKPDKLYDIVVQVALIRPGPIQAKFVHPYTERRLGREPVTYAHPALEPILKRTQGIPIFQEQAMAVAMTLGGYTGSEADELRRTMGNQRKKGRLERALEKLEARMIEREVTPEIAKRICDDLLSFANYGFPESHAWSFALISYATAYLKTHHPAEFFLGLLNSWPMGFYPVSTLIHDARRNGVDVRPPCLRDGSWECTVEETAEPIRPALRIGWRHIHGIGTTLIETLRTVCAVRPFTSIEDAVHRARLTRSDALALARAGAFGGWEGDRRRAAWEALRAVGDTLPLAPTRHAPHEPPALDTTALIFLDYATVGASIHGHPMQSVRERLRAWGALDSRDLQSMHRSGRRIVVGGLVTVRQRPETANGTIFLLLEDEHGLINVVVPSQLVDRNEEVVKRAPFILVQGRFERDGDEISVIGGRFRKLDVQGIVHRSRDFH